MQVDFNKKYVTRIGEEVILDSTVIAFDAYPVIGVRVLPSRYPGLDDLKVPARWSVDGKYYKNLINECYGNDDIAHPLDLIEVTTTDSVEVLTATVILTDKERSSLFVPKHVELPKPIIQRSFFERDIGDKDGVELLQYMIERIITLKSDHENLFSVDDMNIILADIEVAMGYLNEQLTKARCIIDSKVSGNNNGGSIRHLDMESERVNHLDEHFECLTNSIGMYKIDMMNGYGEDEVGRVCPLLFEKLFHNITMFSKPYVGREYPEHIKFREDTSLSFHNEENTITDASRICGITENTIIPNQQETMGVSAKKFYRTVGGDDVIITMVRGESTGETEDDYGSYPVTGVIIDKKIGSMSAEWTIDGKFKVGLEYPHEYDLVELDYPKKDTLVSSPDMNLSEGIIDTIIEIMNKNPGLIMFPSVNYEPQSGGFISKREPFEDEVFMESDIPVMKKYDLKVLPVNDVGLSLFVSDEGILGLDQDYIDNNNFLTDIFKDHGDRNNPVLIQKLLPLTVWVVTKEVIFPQNKVRYDLTLGSITKIKKVVIVGIERPFKSLDSSEWIFHTDTNEILEGTYGIFTLKQLIQRNRETYNSYGS